MPELPSGSMAWWSLQRYGVSLSVTANVSPMLTYEFLQLVSFTSGRARLRLALCYVAA